MPKSNVVSEEERSLRFLSDPDSWQYWPVCPLKKKGTLTTAIALDAPFGLKLIIGANIWALPKIRDLPPENFIDATPQQILDLGWRVD